MPTAATRWIAFMPRKRKLDKYVTSFVDRHGKERFRFRREGVSRYLPPPGTKDYREAYSEALTGVHGLSRAKRGSVGDLAARFYQSVKFRNAGLKWQGTMRSFIEPFREEFGKDMVADFRPRHINLILAAKIDQQKVGKRVRGGTAAAKRLREVLMRLFDFAVSDDMIETNPVARSEKVAHKVKGFYTWTEADVAQYRAHWPLGTVPRLAMELMLWTGSRIGNAHKMPPPVNGRFNAVAVKTGSEIDMRVAPPLQAAIDAMPPGSIGTEALIVTGKGKPYTVDGFGNKVREWCDGAGLPQCTAHGLRKTLATRAANAGVSQQELKSLGQWKGDEEVRLYTENADRGRLADGALDRVAAWEQAGTDANNG